MGSCSCHFVSIGEGRRGTPDRRSKLGTGRRGFRPLSPPKLTLIMIGLKAERLEKPLDIELGLWSHDSLSVYNYDPTTGGSKSSGGFYLVQTCEHYSFGSSGAWKTAQVMSILVVLIGGLILFLKALQSCGVFKLRHENAVLFVAFIWLCLFQGLTLMFLSSCKSLSELVGHMVDRNRIMDNQALGEVEVSSNCKLSSAANVAIAGTVMWFIAAICSGDALLAERRNASSKGQSAGQESGLDEPLLI